MYGPVIFSITTHDFKLFNIENNVKTTISINMGRTHKNIASVQNWNKKYLFSSEPGIPVVRSMGPVVSYSATCWDLTDVTLADEDTNSIPTDNALYNNHR